MESVLITGAYGGMGRSAVKLFREQGFRVFALDKKVGEAEDNIIPIEADITSENSVQEAFATVNEYTDSLHSVIHFAGIYMLDSLVEMSDEAFSRIFDVNVRGVFLINKVFLPLLKRGSKILITTSELAPLDPLPFTGIYAVTKSALDKYAYSLKMELQLIGINVSVLRAGAVKTGMLGASTAALNDFCNKTRLYRCNADRFKKIVDSVEARNISPDTIAHKTLKIIKKRNPAFAYSINRNVLLVLLNLLPKPIQLRIIKMILK